MHIEIRSRLEIARALFKAEAFKASAYARLWKKEKIFEDKVRAQFRVDGKLDLSSDSKKWAPSMLSPISNLTKQQRTKLIFLIHAKLSVDLSFE